MREFSFEKFVTVVLAGALLMLFMAGCTATKSVTVTYDAEGRITSRTETQESVVKEITASTANKTVVAWESGWAAYISGSTATNDDPTPHVKMFAGKTDKGVISALPNQAGWDGIAETVRATKYDLQLTPNGLTSASSDRSDPSDKSDKSGGGDAK